MGGNSQLFGKSYEVSSTTWSHFQSLVILARSGEDPQDPGEDPGEDPEDPGEEPGEDPEDPGEEPGEDPRP